MKFQVPYSPRVGYLLEADEFSFVERSLSTVLGHEGYPSELKIAVKFLNMYCLEQI